MERYLVRIENAMRYIPSDVGEIASKFRMVVENTRTSLHNFRISEVAVEFDLFTDDRKTKDRIIGLIVNQFGTLLTERNLSEVNLPVEDKAQVVNQTILLFNEQRFWECHEIMEGVWKKEEVLPEKEVENGIILAASALVHAQKGETGVCLGMLPRAIERLAKWERGEYYGLNLTLLRDYLRRMIATQNVTFQKL